MSTPHSRNWPGRRCSRRSSIQTARGGTGFPGRLSYLVRQSSVPQTIAQRSWLDVAVLQAFRAAQDTAIRRGVPHALETSYGGPPRRRRPSRTSLRPFEILGYVASRTAGLDGNSDGRRGLPRAVAEIEAVRSREAAPGDAAGWRRLSAIYRQTGEVTADSEATLQLVALPNTQHRELSQTAARLNGLIRDGAC